MKFFNSVAAGRFAQAWTTGHVGATTSAILLATVLASRGDAQSLMVGADGAVHLDAMQQGKANAPVVIQQAPAVMPAQMVAPVMQAPMQYPMQSPMQYPVQSPMMAGQVPWTTGGVACPPCETCPPCGACQPCVPCQQPMAYVPVVATQPERLRCSVFGDFLYLHPTGADVAHAQQQDGLGGAGTVPFGIIGVTDFEYEPGIRVGGEFELSQCTSLVASYTFFESSTTDFLAPPVIPGGGGAVGSLVIHPGAAITASIGPVEAEAELDFQLADGEYRARIVGDECFDLTGSVGLRFAHLEQEFHQSGVFAGGNGGAINTDTDIDFDGGGVKLGLHGMRHLGDTRFSIYGRANVSPLVGHFHSSYSMFNETTGTMIASSLFRITNLASPGPARAATCGSPPDTWPPSGSTP
jgi:hypothetical protein